MLRRFSYLMTIICVIFSLSSPLYAQPVSGYSRTSDGFYFFNFVEQEYGLEQSPTRVVVTGSFRDWSQDMETTDWDLKAEGDGVWTLAIPKTLTAGGLFKFRINDGQWLEPPAFAANVQSGNLVYQYTEEPSALSSDLINRRAIEVNLSGNNLVDHLDPKYWKLSRYDGKIIPIEEVLINTDTKAIIVPKEPIDIKRVHYVEFLPAKLKDTSSFDGWFKYMYSDKTLGAELSEDGQSTSFRVFAPRATAMKLYLYKKADDKKAYAIYDMAQDQDGVWESILPKNLKGVYYDFTVHGPADEPGSNYFEKTGTHCSDPYARVSVDTFGKCRVWEKTTPAVALKNGIPAYEDVISYEVHVQDFTDLLPVKDELKGTLTAMATPGLKNERGEAIGFDHLKNLGINVVHLMPVQEYLHYPDEEWQAAFKDDPYMIEQGVNMENYQWGYRTTHAFAIETRFREKGSEYGAQREQFRDLVSQFHKNDMAVIVDFVFNHTGENMDGRHYNFNFNALDKHYYYRLDENGEHIGAFGNETKSENRPMMQRWIIDQCKYFIEEFGVDGFRIDIAGQTDEQTLRALKEAVGPDIIIYGEPWIASNDPNYEANPAWDWYKVDSPITFFQDEARNAFKGSPDNPDNKWEDRGYAGGDISKRADVMQGLTNLYDDEANSNMGINYLDIHDNWALADRFATENWDGRFGVDEARFKLAAALLFTSNGPIVLHGGTEFMRSKGAAPLKEITKEIASGPLAYHGKRDTYNTRNANHFIWENIGKEGSSTNPDYKHMLDYWKALMALRNSEYGKVMRIGERLAEDHYVFSTPENNEGLLAYTIGGKVAVAMNVGLKTDHLELHFPKGEWKLVGTINEIDLDGVTTRAALNNVKANSSNKISLNPEEIFIWINVASE